MQEEIGANFGINNNEEVLIKPPQRLLTLDYAGNNTIVSNSSLTVSNDEDPMAM